VPPHIRTLIQRCLTKERRHRTADISVALFVMNEATSLAPAGAAASAASRIAIVVVLAFIGLSLIG